MSCVAVIPAKDSNDTIVATVKALMASVDEVIVVDDGSADSTGDSAAQAGATVITMPRNVGKGAAMRAGIDAAPNAKVLLFVDADTGESARGALVLLDPIRTNQCDLAIGVLPSAAGKGGFGLVRNFAAWGIKRSCGFEAAAPLSGQRAVTAALVHQITLAPRFGVEVAMTIDAVRTGARVREVPVLMDHKHRGRQLDGFRHRGRQGWEIALALLPRLVSGRFTR